MVLNMSLYQQIIMQYNHDKTFEEQDEEVKEELISKCYEFSPNLEIKETAGLSERVLEQHYEVDGIKIKKVFKYLHSPEHESNGLIEKEHYEVVS
jgi:CO dehydrogenase/acetyl-CoA synthase epsilon subunit